MLKNTIASHILLEIISRYHNFKDKVKVSFKIQNRMKQNMFNVHNNPKLASIDVAN